MASEMIAQLERKTKRHESPSDPMMVMAITRDPSGRKSVDLIRKNCSNACGVLTKTSPDATAKERGSNER